MPLRRFLAVLAITLAAANSLRAEPWLGDAPRAPKDVSGLPGAGPRPKLATSGFIVDTGSREQVRSFYNAVYTASDGVPIGTTANISSCTPGTNSSAFQQSVLRRINWYRALAGLPATITFDSGESTQNQAAALMMSANTNLQHTLIPPTWHCFSTAGTNAAANSNLALGYAGPDAITSYIRDFGANNYEAAHRRWILYPQTQVMGTGDVPMQGNFFQANATWVFDANYGGPRPATRTPFVAWPPAGYAPYSVVYPRWSFALSNADLSTATISMKSNGVSVAVIRETYVADFYGENTIVWYPSNLDPVNQNTVFPFNGTDTVYSVTISNVITATGNQNYAYTVTVFDPAVPGGDSFPPLLSGTNRPTVNAGNLYTCTPVPDPNVTGYRWLTAQRVSGNLFDGAEGGLGNFTISPAPVYPVITNTPVISGTHSFHLTHSNAVPQLFQLNRLFFPASNSVVSFQSELGYATSFQTARVQVSVNGGVNWQDIYTQAGSGGPGETAFTLRTLSLSNYVAKPTLLRFNYDFSTGSYYYQSDPGVGWALDNILVTNISQLVNFTTNVTASTNFTFTPTVATNYNLQASAILFTDFPLDGGPVEQVTSVTNLPVITLATPVIVGNQVQLNFSVSAGPAATFRLLTVNQLGQAWITNAGAALTTNIPGSSYRYTTTNGPATRFYRIQTP
ncbi:MAG TPA: CAP domain-containing protein [Verrucomicrobiae bacterium]|nr:CAP domain-containing protein [Verrucomicrobiae bacterium]